MGKLKNSGFQLWKKVYDQKSVYEAVEERKILEKRGEMEVNEMEERKEERGRVMDGNLRLRE